MDLSTTETWRWIWLGVAAVFTLGEIVVAGTFFLLPFGIGGFVAAILGFATTSVTVTWVAFVAVSAAAFAALVPIGRRLERSTTEAGRGIGSDRWVGRRGIVLSEIPAGPGDTGLVRIDREEWRAEGVGGHPIASGTEIVVVRVDGTRLVVEAAGGGTAPPTP